MSWSDGFSARTGLFHTADGAVQLAVGSDAHLKDFADEFGLPVTDTRFESNAARVEHRPDLHRLVDAAFGDLSSATVLARLARSGIPAGEVKTLEQMYASAQTRSQGLLVTVLHPDLGQLTLPGPPIRFDGSADFVHQPPPRLGEHDSEIRAWLAARKRP